MNATVASFFLFSSGSIFSYSRISLLAVLSVTDSMTVTNSQIGCSGSWIILLQTEDQSLLDQVIPVSIMANPFFQIKKRFGLILTFKGDQKSKAPFMTF